MRHQKYLHLFREKSLAQTKSTFTTIKSGSRLLYSEPKESKKVNLTPKNIRNDEKFQQQQQSVLWIYFDKDAKNAYNKKTIDKYFKSEKQQKGISYTPKNISYNYKNCNKVIQSERATAINKIQTFKNQLKARRKQICRLQLKIQDNSCLPIITQNIYQKRPVSEHKKIKLSQSAHSIQPQQLTISQSSKKSISSSQSIQQTFQSSFYETFRKTKPMNGIVDKLNEFTNNGMKFYEREIKMEKYRIPLIWKNGHCLEEKKVKCLRQELYSIREDAKGNEGTFTIYPNSLYYRLFANNNEGLANIIIDLCRQFMKIKDKVINPKVNINSIYRVEQQKVIMEWGTSAFQDILKIRDFQYTSYENPVIGGSKQWCSVPEYLSPQIIRDYTNNWNSKQIWQHSTSSHIWQLGCLILQLLILIPLWMPYRCTVNNLHKFKKGLLYTRSRTLLQISAKQKIFISSGIRNALKQTIIPVTKIRPQILKIISKCLKEDPKERITPDEIISFLQS